MKLTTVIIAIVLCCIIDFCGGRETAVAVKPPYAKVDFCGNTGPTASVLYLIADQLNKVCTQVNSIDCSQNIEEFFGAENKNYAINKINKIFCKSDIRITNCWEGICKNETSTKNARKTQNFRMQTQVERMILEEPYEDPEDDPEEYPEEDPEDDPVEDPVDDPVEDPEEDPEDDPVEDPVEDPEDDPVEDPEEDPEDPEEYPEEDPEYYYYYEYYYDYYYEDYYVEETNIFQAVEHDVAAVGKKKVLQLCQTFEKGQIFEFPKNSSMVLQLLLQMARYSGECNPIKVPFANEQDKENILCAIMQSDGFLDNCSIYPFFMYNAMFSCNTILFPDCFGKKKLSKLNYYDGGPYNFGPEGVYKYWNISNSLVLAADAGMEPGEGASAAPTFSFAFLFLVYILAILL